MCKLGSNKKSAVNSRVSNILGVISIVEFWKSDERRNACTLQDWETLNLVLKEGRYAFEESRGECAWISLATEVSEKTVSVERLISKEEKRHPGRHLELLA